MITIQKNSSKLVYFTLSEKTTLSTPYYIFEIKSVDNNYTYFTGEDNSLNKDRYNSFTFSSGSVATYSCGFDLNVGEYSYTVYETPNYNSIDTSTASVVELGIFKVTGTTSNTEYTGLDSETIVTYTGLDGVS